MMARCCQLLVHTLIMLWPKLNYMHRSTICYTALYQLRAFLDKYQHLCQSYFFKVFFLWDTFTYLILAHWYPYSGFLVMSPLSFKAKVDLPYSHCRVKCNIHSLKSTSGSTWCQPLDGQHCWALTRFISCPRILLTPVKLEPTIIGVWVLRANHSDLGCFLKPKHHPRPHWNQNERQQICLKLNMSSSGLAIQYTYQCRGCSLCHLSLHRYYVILYSVHTPRFSVALDCKLTAVHILLRLHNAIQRSVAERKPAIISVWKIDVKRFPFV